MVHTVSFDYTDGQVTEQNTAEDMGKNNPNPKTQYYSMKSNDVTVVKK